MRVLTAFESTIWNRFTVGKLNTQEIANSLKAMFPSSHEGHVYNALNGILELVAHGVEVSHPRP